MKKAKAYIDGSFLNNMYAYGAVFTYEGEEYHLCGKGTAPGYIAMRNVAGEIISAMIVIRKAIEMQASAIEIYYDYSGIEKWATGEWNAKKEETKFYQQFVQKAREKIDISFHKVKGHSGVPGNEKADALANKAYLLKAGDGP